MDELTKRMKDKKSQEGDSSPDAGKKARIMGMHADGDDITSIRCEYCSERFSAGELKEHNGLYYCSNCLQKLQSEE